MCCTCLVWLFSGFYVLVFIPFSSSAAHFLSIVFTKKSHSSCYQHIKQLSASFFNAHSKSSSDTCSASTTSAPASSQSFLPQSSRLLLTSASTLVSLHTRPHSLVALVCMSATLPGQALSGHLFQLCVFIQHSLQLRCSALTLVNLPY